MFIMFLVIIISSAAFWNVMTVGTAAAGTFEIIVSIINFLVEIGLLIHFGRKFILE
ncbi:MAG: hypothetical protein SPI94_05805 [Candidatus Onthovivens sp.]|nr:hypothetical protein [Candidatus Onthovivens sp.]